MPFSIRCRAASSIEVGQAFQGSGEKGDGGQESPDGGDGMREGQVQ